MNAEMEITIVIVWLVGVVCGTGFFTGLGVLAYYLYRKKYAERLLFPFIAVVIGFSGMSYSLFTLLRMIRTWVAA